MADARELPPPSFSSFVVSLASSAMEHLGETNAPGVKPDLLMARQTIDLLGILEDKTEGNLDEEEQKLLDTLLFELRTKFIEKQKTLGTEE